MILGITYPQLINFEVVAHSKALFASFQVAKTDVSVVAEIDVLIVAVEMGGFLVEAVYQLDAIVGEDVEEGVHVLDIRPMIVFSDLFFSFSREGGDR